MAKGTGCVVVSAEEKLVGLLTQRDVAVFLWEKLGDLEVEEDSTKSIEQLGIYRGPSKVLVLYEDRPAITAFALMAIHGVKSMPILGL